MGRRTSPSVLFRQGFDDADGFEADVDDLADEADVRGFGEKILKCRTNRTFMLDVLPGIPFERRTVFLYDSAVWFDRLHD